ncbi:hypothetical protein Syun_006967 [Stephania yunnanensis]|uniref:Kinesin motor domain-containing protein n=1 Tax=Stephania yunnanensis TaxID=152371 RepID=A0AAP0KXS1_9MAGN
MASETIPPPHHHQDADEVQIGSHAFTFDHVYSGTSSSSYRIFEDCISPLVDAFFGGYNATVLAYGQNVNAAFCLAINAIEVKSTLIIMEVIPFLVLAAEMEIIDRSVAIKDHVEGAPEESDFELRTDHLNAAHCDSIVLVEIFSLSRAYVALASLRNTEGVLARFTRCINEHLHLQVVSLLAKVVEHLVKRNHANDKHFERRCSCEVSMLAYDYGKNLGLAYQVIDDVLDFTGTTASLGKPSSLDIHHGIVTAPILFAMEEFPQPRTALEYLGKSNEIQRARELASQHAKLADVAIESLPESDDEDVQRSRRALVDITHRIKLVEVEKFSIQENRTVFGELAASHGIYGEKHEQFFFDVGNYIPISPVRDDVAAEYKKGMEWKASKMLLPYKQLFMYRGALTSRVKMAITSTTMTSNRQGLDEDEITL